MLIMVDQKLLKILSGPFLFLILINIPLDDITKQPALNVLASTVWMATWWILEIVPIAVTALIPVIIYPIFANLSIKNVAANYGHPYVFLYLGGFLVALAIEKYNLHRRMALTILYFIGTQKHKVILGFMVATAFMSMWISNTATAVMMLPVGISIIHIIDNSKIHNNNDDGGSFGKALLLAIAYSASIGGIATLIGTPPNLVLAGVLKDKMGIEISFFHWLKIGLPISVIMLIFVWVYLVRLRYYIDSSSFSDGKGIIRTYLKELGKITANEQKVFIIFLLTALAWICRPIINLLVPQIDDTIIALSGGLSLFFVSRSDYKGKFLLTWQDTKNLPWDIILLFGGGMALAHGFDESGLTQWISFAFEQTNHLTFLVFLLLVITMVNFLTEVTSNLATTAMLLPILYSVCISLDFPPDIVMIGATLAASCAFMLPVATPPNTVVFSSNQLRIKDMVTAGVFINILSILLITGYAYIFLR